MKANELMIGDWVHYSMNLGKDGIYEKDIQISNIYGFDVNCDVRDYTIIGGRHMSNLSPIPLTAEILEKNGFRYEHDYGSYYRSILGDYANDNDPVVSIGWNSKGEMCEWDIADGKRGVSYGRHLLGVHELQHALRLCGLTELADNFKVE